MILTSTPTGDVPGADGLALRGVPRVRAAGPRAPGAGDLRLPAHGGRGVLLVHRGGRLPQPGQRRDVQLFSMKCMQLPEFFVRIRQVSSRAIHTSLREYHVDVLFMNISVTMA